MASAKLILAMTNLEKSKLGAVSAARSYWLWLSSYGDRVGRDMVLVGESSLIAYCNALGPQVVAGWLTEAGIPHPVCVTISLQREQNL